MLAAAIAACGGLPEPASFDPKAVDPFDVERVTAATLAARTARFATATEVAVIGGDARPMAAGEGVVDLEAATGRHLGWIVPNPFAPQGEGQEPIEVETVTVEGRGSERTPGDGSETWRDVDGRLGQFLQLGNRAATFEEAVRQLVEPVGPLVPTGHEDVRGVRTVRYEGVAGTDGELRQLWIDGDGRLRRVTSEEPALSGGGGRLRTTVEFWEFGVPVAPPRLR